MRVSISAYDDGDLLAGCLESIREELGDVPIHVVDGKYLTWPEGADNSTDRTPEIADEYNAQYDPAGPFERECDKHEYRAESLPQDEWVLLMDADERLLSFDESILQSEVAFQPRIINARVYHEFTPVAYWPRLHKPKWIVNINRWDAYLYSTPEPPKTDRVTILHRHDLRDRDYREAKYQRFQNEERDGRYQKNGLEEDYYSNELQVETTECPECGENSVTWSPFTKMHTDEITSIGVCIAGDRCCSIVKTVDLYEWKYLPGNWAEGLREDPDRLRLECVDAGWGYACMSPVEGSEFGLKRWIEEEFGSEYVTPGASA